MDNSQEVRQLEAERQHLLGEMEHLKKQFLDVVAEWLRPWWEKQLRAVVAAEPQLAEKLGKEGLRMLKDRVAQLQERASEVVASEAGATYFWWHHQQKHLLRDEDKDSYRSPSAQGAPTIPWRQSVAIRNAAGQLWPILKDAGYLVRQGADPLDQGGRWVNWPSYSTSPAANARPYYPHALHGLPPKLQPLMQRYEALIPLVEEKGRILAARTHSSAREDALKLFDEA